jgi:hypothetical protein
LSEIIATTAGDIVLEFSNGAFSVPIPLKNIVYEKSRSQSTISINGFFDVGTEYLNSQSENVLDKLFENNTTFNIMNRTNTNDVTTPAHVFDNINNIRIFMVRTVIPGIGETNVKRYFFSTTNADIYMNDIRPIDTTSIDVKNVRVVNTLNINNPDNYDSAKIEAVVIQAIRNSLRSY